MIEEHLSRIRSQEEAAKSRVAEAEIKAAELVEKSREDGAKHLDDVRGEAHEIERSLMAAARWSADERISMLRAENAKKLAALVVLAKKNRERAVEMIVKAFRGGA